MITGLFHFVWKVIWATIVILVCAGLNYLGYKINLSMMVSEAPEGMTYVEFIQDRIDAAKTVEPSRYGWGMLLSLATLGPIYSVVYASVAIHPDSTLAKMTAPASDIPKGAASAKWNEIPGI